MGTTCAYPPPAAPPLTPNTGPSDGSRRATMDFLPIFLSPSARPTDVVVLPSPAGVGVIAVTRISFPSGLSAISFRSLLSILALYLPYCSIYFSSTPIFSAISVMGLISHSCAICISVLNSAISSSCEYGWLYFQIDYMQNITPCKSIFIAFNLN